MISDRRTVHTQLFYSGYIFFDLIGAIQKAVFCMNMKMCKIHIFILYYAQLLNNVDTAVFDLDLAFFEQMSYRTFKCIFAQTELSADDFR